MLNNKGNSAKNREEMKKLKFSGATVTWFIVLLLLIDQAVKIYVKTHFTINESVTVFEDWFFIHFIENPGAAFGFQFGGEYGKMILSLLRIVAVALLSVYIHSLMKRQAPKGIIMGFSLILVGALGNIVDCMFYGMIFSESTVFNVATLFPEGGGYGTFLHGFVVDMLYFPLIESTFPEWFPIVGGEDFVFFSPIFNLADTYISVGFLYLLIFQNKYFRQ